MPLVGTPTIKGVIKNARASGYNFTKAMGDIIDGSMTMPDCTEVHIKIKESTGNPDKIHSIIVSDNKRTGMDSLKYTDSKHPLCWTRDSEEHNSDDAISEFGAGLKSAAVNLGARMVFSTKRVEKKEKKYEKYECDWEKMIENNTFDPTSINQLNRDEFNKLHVDSNNNPLNNGTTFEIREIHPEFAPSTESAINDLKAYISNTYQFKDRAVYVNGEKIEYNSPYTERKDYPHQIYSIKIEIFEKEIIIHPILPNINNKVKNPKAQYMSYNRQNMKYMPKCILKNSDYDDIKNTQKLKDTCVIKATYIHGFSAESIGFCGGTVSISRNNRMLTMWSKDDPKFISFSSSKFHMEQNYNYLNLNYNSKSTGKLLGVSYTKSIDGNFPKNKLVASLGLAEKKLRAALGTSTSYKRRWLENNPYNIAWDSELSYKDNVEMITKEEARIAKEQEEAMIAKQQEKERIAKQKQEARIAKQKQEAMISKQKQEARIAKQQKEALISKQQEEAIISKQEEERITKQQEDESIPKQPNDQKPVEKLESKPLNNQINIDIDSGAESIVVNTPDDEYTNNSQVIQAEIDTESKDDKESTDDSADNCIEVSCNSINHSKVQDYGIQNYLGLYGCSLDGINIQNGNEYEAKIGYTKQYPKKRANGGSYSKEKLMMISIDSVKINCETLLKSELEKIPGVEFSTDEKFTFLKDKYSAVKKTYNNVVNDHLCLD